MNNIDRLEEYENIDFDRLIIDINRGKVKCGKYAHLVKIKENNKKENNHGSKNNDKFK
jgi:hypothetical protein